MARLENESVDSLGIVAAGIACRSALAWVRANVVTVPEDLTALNEALRRHCRLRLPEALQDAKDAIDCGMRQVAEQTFAASMSLAGIDAAKEVFSS